MNKFDHILAKKLNKYASPVNDDVWSNIEEELFPSKRNPIGWYVAASTLMLALLFAVVWYLMPQSEEAQSVIADAKIEKVESKSSEVDRNSAIQVKEDAAIADASSTNYFKESIQPKEENIETKILNTNNLSIIKNTNIINADLGNTSPNNLNDPVSTNSNEQYQGSSLSQSTLSKLSQSTPTVQQNIAAPSKLMENHSVENHTYNDNIVYRKSKELESEVIDKDVVDKNVSYQTTINKNKTMVATVDRNEYKLNILPKLNTQVTSDDLIRINPKIEIPKVDYSMAISIDIFGGLDLPMQTLEAVDDESNPNLFARQNTEVNYTSWNSGFRVSFYPNRKFALRTGFLVNQYNVKFNYIDLDATQEDILVVGQDSLVYTVSGQREVQHLNHYRSYSIPIQLGITSSKGPWSISFNPGVLLNLSSTVNGRSLDSGNHVFEIDSQTTDYKSNFGMSFFGSIGMGYAVSSKLDFYIEPNIRYNMSSITTSEAAVNERFTSIGLLTGFRYHL